jgi:hypothetical protein
MADINVHYDPISVVSGPVTVDVQGLDNTKNTITLETPQPLKSETAIGLAVTQPIETDSKFEFSTPQPLRAESKAELDVKPLAIDQCLRISLAPLPPTCIRFPIHQQIGLTLFGIELIGLRFSGESQVLICDAPKDPHIAWGEVSAASRPERPDDALLPVSDGLRIRLGG